MNIFTIGVQNKFAENHKSGGVFAGNLRLIQGGALKSTQEKLERQQKACNQIEFWENQKENLKNMECDTVEEIAKKLEMFHNYEDEIAAVKSQYNSEQMFHILDEAEEQGEKNAEAAKKTEPKTPEERQEEIAKEASGEEESESVLEEMLDDVTDVTEELTDAGEELVDAEKETTEETVTENEKSLEEEYTDDLVREAAVRDQNLETMQSGVRKPILNSYLVQRKEERQRLYRGLDIKI